MDMIPAGRPGQGDDIAQGVLFLAGSNYTNGHCLVIGAILARNRIQSDLSWPERASIDFILALNWL